MEGRACAVVFDILTWQWAIQAQTPTTAFKKPVTVIKLASLDVAELGWIYGDLHYYDWMVSLLVSGIFPDLVVCAGSAAALINPCDHAPGPQHYLPLIWAEGRHVTTYLRV